MAQTGYTPISIYYSATATNVPLAADLVAGELAINTADGKLFYKDSAGVVQQIAQSGTLPVSKGGTGASTLAANNVLLGNGTSAIQAVAPSTAGNVLTSNGTTWVSAASAAGGFPAGTVMLFAQTSAPTGWTKNTTTGDNSALRVVTGTASTGGSVAFTTAFASQAVTITAISGSAGATTLSTPQIPSHTHTLGATSATQFRGYDQPPTAFTSNTNTGATGGGGSHDHPFSFTSATANAINLAVQYIDVIRATKD